MDGSGGHAMTKKKGPQMANPSPAQEALISEIESLIEDAAESVDKDELAERERKANEVVERVRARVSRQGKT
jgi:ElaB/YqjD/DUF883 family membrane-anchored ribosome-binding protein